MRTRVQVLAHVHERDPGIHLHSGRQLPARDGSRYRQRPLGRVDHRPQPQRLLDDGVEVGIVGRRGELLPQATEDAGIAQQQVESEGEAGRRRLVACAQHREQLIAQLAVRHRATLLVACAQ